MSSALPPILPAEPPARRAAAPEDPQVPGAFERALGLATLSQAPVRVDPPAATPLSSRQAEEQPSTEASASAEAPLPMLHVARPGQGSAPDPGSPVTAEASEPVAIPGRPFSSPPLPAIEGERKPHPSRVEPPAAPARPASVITDPDRSNAASAPLAAREPSGGDLRGQPIDPRSSAGARLALAVPPASSGAARSEASRGADPSVPGSPQASAAAMATRAAEGVTRAVPSGLPAALALDVRVIASRIAPVLRRGGLIDSERRPAGVPVAAASAPATGPESPANRPVFEEALVPGALRIDAKLAPAPAPALAAPEPAPTGRMPVAPAVQIPLESVPLVRMAEVAASIPAAETRKGDPSTAAATNSADPDVSPHDPAVRVGARNGTGEARVAVPAQPAPREGPQAGASPGPHASRREGTESTQVDRRESGERAARAERSAAPAQRPALEPSSESEPVRQARVESAVSSASPGSASAGPTTSGASADAPAAPLSAEPVPMPASARSIGTSSASGASAPNTESAAADRAEAALAARLSPERRAADRVTLRFEGEGGLEGRLRVSVRGDQVNARILSEDASTLERLGGELRSLQRALEGQGFRDSRVSMQDLRTSGAAAEPRPEARPGEDRRQGEPGRRQTGEERRGDPGPDGQRNRRGAREGRQGT